MKNKVGRPPLNEPTESSKLYKSTMQRFKQRQKELRKQGVIKSIAKLVDEAERNMGGNKNEQ